MMAIYQSFHHYANKLFSEGKFLIGLMSCPFRNFTLTSTLLNFDGTQAITVYSFT